MSSHSYNVRYATSLRSPRDASNAAWIRLTDEDTSPFMLCPEVVFVWINESDWRACAELQAADDFRGRETIETASITAQDGAEVIIG